MDDVAVGLAFRRVRLRRNERQIDVAARAGMSQSAYSLLERGHLARPSLGAIRRAATALEIRVELVARWRGGDLDRLIHGRHAAMGEAVAARLRLAGWDVEPEVSFNHFGERGVVDLVGWHRGTATMLLIELKTELVDVNDLLAVMNRRQRLAEVIGQGSDWRPARVASWVVIADSRSNRRRVSSFSEILRAAFPQDGRQVSGWLRRPTGAHRALWFLTDATTGGLGRSLAPRKRVGRPRSSSSRAPRS